MGWICFVLFEFTELNRSIYLGFAYWEHADAGVLRRGLS